MATLASLEHAQQHYKSCVHCFTYYCRAECRQQHWQKHKEKCIYARAVSTTKAILRYVFQNAQLMEHYIELGAVSDHTVFLIEQYIWSDRKQHVTTQKRNIEAHFNYAL